MGTRGSSREPIVVDDTYRYVSGDALRTVGSLGPLWLHHTHGGGIDADVLDAVASGLRADIARITGCATTATDAATCFDELGTQMSKSFDALSSEQLSNVISSMWRQLARLRDTTRSITGEVSSLHVSRGGVPKPRVDAIDIAINGIGGDKQANRTHHGRPWQAVCLWSRDVVDAFAAAGHPINAGFAGENISVRGIDWSLVRPGVVVDVGTSSIRVTAYSIPCKQNAGWFADRDFMAMSHERGWVSRVYGLVLQPGRVAVGDAVTLHY